MLLAQLPTQQQPQARQTRASYVVRALESAYDEIRRQHPDAAPAVIIVYYNQRSYGHIWFNAWSVTNTEKLIDEIHLNSILLHEGPEAVLHTLLHETAHSINRVRGIQDCSRGNQYHNHHFKAAAEEVGLITDKHPIIGYITKDLAPGTAEIYQKALLTIKSALTIYQKPLTSHSTDSDETQETEGGQDTPEEEPKSTNRQIKAICQCNPPRIIRASRKTLEAAPIICSACESAFDFDV